MNRAEIIRQLKEQPEVSVLIVGGGINGIGVFRDLALQGVDVLLVERSDFCSGASAASSHMAHGGIRYLENGEFRLVREAVRERNLMLKNAPHLVRPLPTTIPIFKWFSGLLNAPLKFLNLLDRPAERGAVVIKVGLMLYDAFAGRQRAAPRHQFHLRAETLKRYPDLNQEVICTATYYDGAILNPERLAIEVLLDGEQDNPNARALNYASLQDGEGESVRLKDELSGEIFTVRPRLLINAAGPWIDISNRALGLETRYISGTKGSHLVIDNPVLRQSIGEHEFFFENNDGRIVLIFPLYDRVMIGTSDIPIKDPESVRCTEDEVDYFITMVARIFPGIKVRREQIVFQFSGVRPLPFSHAKTTGQISRDHSVEVLSGMWTGLSFPVYSLIGGKWTSFRAFAEQVTDRALHFLQKERRKSTAFLPIGGGRGFTLSEEDFDKSVEGLAAWTGLSVDRVRKLTERYGARAELISNFIARSETDPLLKTLPGYSRREIAFLAQIEKVVHLDDLVLRRTKLAMLGQLTARALEELADALAEALEWSGEQKKAEVVRTLEILGDRHNLHLD
ncbi:MAG: glycerol-3-phosphate dehydrogenase/oxidase [Anaerolineales bacterium]|nr:glycerol-3-phosphate dehydrogenase/oxidase [Anaerolineales bacterium]